MLAEMSKWSDYELRVIFDSEKRQEICLGADVPKDLPAIMLADESEAASMRAQERFNEGLRGDSPWPSLYFTTGGKGGMRVKKHLSEMLGKVVPTFWPSVEVGTTTEATSEIKKLFDGRSLFDTPKPIRLIERVLQIATNKDSLVLDSFAGSGTTAHAVLRLNAEDGGSRRFILAELDNYADTVTAERVRRVIAGYGEGNKAVEGVDSGFSYYELGPVLFRSDGMISPGVTRADLARYVWATETRAPYEDLTGEHPYLLGEQAQAVYYLAWEPGEETALTYDLLWGLPRKGVPTVIYADRCAIAPERLDEMGVVFKRVPDQIARI